MVEVASTVGMQEVSNEFNDIVADAYHSRLLREQGVKAEPDGMHLVLAGNPGTGKTMIAEKIAQVYGALGITPSDKMVSATRADLVGGYIGQTAEKVREVFDKARGGVLFVDEAYALYQDDRDSFGKEALTELMALAENHRSDTVVILAGYPNEMDGFFNANPGLTSRFPKWITFPDYNAQDLGTIGRQMMDKGGLVLDGTASGAYDDAMEAIKDDPRFTGNARDIRQFNTMIRRSVARRVAGIDDPQREDVVMVTQDDVEAGFRSLVGSVRGAAKAPERRKKPKRGKLVPVGEGAA